MHDICGNKYKLFGHTTIELRVNTHEAGVCVETLTGKMDMTGKQNAVWKINWIKS